MRGASDSGDRSFDESHAHIVGVYERDEDLVASVAPYLAGAFAEGGTALVIATPEHCDAFAAALDARGVPGRDLADTGHFCTFDARTTLERFMVDGRPDACAFTEVVGGLVAAAARAGGPVRLYGEMVALLWDDGNLAGALELETLWNELAERHAFALFCAYSMSSLDGAGDLAAAKAVCDRHTAVAPLPMRVPDAAADPPEVFERLFVAAPTAPQDVRAFVRSALAAWGESQVDGEAEIIASELATNAVRHAQSPFRVSLTRAGSGIRIAVRDASFAAPEHQTWDHSVVGGRGVRLVAALSRAWGSDSETDGKTVWAELARSA